VVHPDILWDEEKGKFWLGITPYPDYVDDFENPSLYYSNDGMHFQSNGIENPLSPEPLHGFNCDPDIFLECDRSLKMTYIETTPPLQILHHLCISSDLQITNDTLWVFPLDTLKQKKSLILSPSIIREKDHYKIFFVELKKGTASPNEVQFAELGSLKNLHQNKFKDLKLPLPND
jgi:hypothetical protein